MSLKNYIAEIEKTYQSGIAREHAYRGILQNLLHEILPEIRATNEPKRIDCGSPDYVLTKKDIPIGYIEAKDIDENLDDKKHQEQLNRYLAALPNFIFTNYLEFYFYQNAQLKVKIKIGEIAGDKIARREENFAQFISLLENFAAQVSQTITSSKDLAEMMASKARLLSQVIEKSILSDEKNNQNSSLKEQMETFKLVLIHDIKAKQFADIYAQTIAYGMFAARFHDQNLQTFSRQEAATLIPKSNPFLRKLFQYVAGYDLDERLIWIVDDLADIFRATNLAELLKNFNQKNQKQDPIIHFYETFLSKYDPALRKSRGVWYTPEAVVNFIVKGVDEILQNEFSLVNGIANSSKITKKVNIGLVDKRTKTGLATEEKAFHRVQILDPATGTGTFLAEIIRQIHQKFLGQQGLWQCYVEEHLIPRLNGFEILMASYAMAHLKLDLLLSETGFNSNSKERFKIFLTNSLEEASEDQNFPLLAFMRELTQEGLEASKVKNEMPVMVILGNPPYSGESQNKSAWIMDLMNSYKKEPASAQKLQERNPKWLNDDYVKFMRLAQHFIEKNGEGVLAFINPHGFLDNPTFRGMRYSLLKAFDKIYVIDLHGNLKKKETALDGSKDENVFDIQQGVSINFFIKTGNKKASDLAKVFHFDLFGKRQEKYNFLLENSLKNIAFKKLENVHPNYFFVPKDFSLQSQYQQGFAVNEIFPVNSVGVVSAKDAILINNCEDELIRNVGNFYQIKVDKNLVQKISYRPFDEKFIYYDLRLVERAREKVMQHFLVGENLGLVFCKQFKAGEAYQHCFLSNQIIESSFISNKTGEINSIAPLYLYSNSSNSNSNLDDFLSSNKITKKPNLNSEIIAKISQNLKLEFVENSALKNDLKNFCPFDVFDYIYAILHSPNYRSKYQEFLKIDFPRIPYPACTESFYKFVNLGKILRKTHLLEENITIKTAYPKQGSNVVENAKFEGDKIHINNEQYFENVTKEFWEFYVGGYNPAQKWLKDRKNKILNFDEILHYQKIIAALDETLKIMAKIDQIQKF